MPRHRRKRIGIMGGKYGNQRAIAPEREQEVIDLYEQVERTRVVAEAFGVSDETVRRILKRHGIPRTRRHAKPKKAPVKRFDKANLPEVIALRERGYTCDEIGERFGFSGGAIYHHLVKAGVIEVVPRKLPKSQISQICALYEQGETNKRIAERFDISPQHVSKIARRNGCEMRGKGNGKTREAVCPQCGKKFTAIRANQVYCKPSCERKATLQRRVDSRRARTGEKIELIPLRAVYERDHGRCYICGRKTDWNDYRMVDGHKVVGLRYPTRDHVIALHNGGAHSWDNIRLACFSCNSRKGASGQMRLAI